MLDFNNSAIADWEPELELSTDNISEGQGSPRVAVENGIVHSVWVDYEDGDGDIYYRISLDEGVTWQPEEDISVDVGTENQGRPSIAVEGDKVHVVWQETLDPMDPSEDIDIVYRYFDGMSWQPKQEISVDIVGNERQERPEIAVEGDNVHVIWHGNNVSNFKDVDVTYRFFDGNSWQPAIELGTDVVFETHQEQPDIAVENGRVHAVWFDARDGGSDKDIYYRCFNGTSWLPEQEISIDSGPGTVGQLLPRIAAEDGEVHVVWQQSWDAPPGEDEVDLYYRHFNGTSWEPPMEVSVDFEGPEGQADGAIAVENGTVHVVYRHFVLIEADIYYRCFDGATWQPAERVSVDDGSIYDQDPYIDVENEIVHTVWREGPWGTENDIIYRRFVPPYPDLQITSQDIVFDPSSPVLDGTPININATVHNIGSVFLMWINVSFYNGDPALGGTLIGTNQTIPVLIEGENATVNITWLPPSPGIYEIFVAVDYPTPGVIAEINESNNIASKVLEVLEFPPPVLYIEPIDTKIFLNWTQPGGTQGVSHYLLYRSTSQTGFNFSDAWVDTSQNDDNGTIPLRTTWNDTGAASDVAPEEYYYIMRTVFESSRTSSTSRTVGKWTKTFSQGVSTFSIPLEPLRTRTTDYYLTDMNATYIRWMNETTHTWMKHGDGDINDIQMKVGEGYEMKLAKQVNYTFTGMPGAMIQYNNASIGFDATPQTGNADSLSADVNPSNGDVNLSWDAASGIDSYYLYNSSSRDGFWGTLGVDYFLLTTTSLGSESHTHIGAAQAGIEQYYMVVPFVSGTGERGVGTYSIGIWTEEYQVQYDTLGIPLKLNYSQTADWYCDNIPDTVGINYFMYNQQRWSWHSTRMREGAYDPGLEMAEGYQISTSRPTKFTFIGI